MSQHTVNTKIFWYGDYIFRTEFLDGTFYAFSDSAPYFVLSAKTREEVVHKAHIAIDQWAGYNDEPKIGKFD